MVTEIFSLDDPRLEVYASLTERNLRNEGSEKGLFIAESPKVIKVALEVGYEPVSLLCEPRHIEGDAKEIISRFNSNDADIPVFTGNRELLSQLTGYKLTRGVLCAMKRKTAEDSAQLCRDSKTVAVIEAVCDTTNIGSIFRSAAALGIDAILLTPDSCDPLNRRSIRVSMGTVFKVKWAFCHDPVSLLHQYGFTTIALALEPDSLPLDSPEFKKKENLAMVLGTEGDGLSKEMISKCDFKAIIPMFHGVDSLNVGAAAAVAFWELAERKRSGN